MFVGEAPGWLTDLLLLLTVVVLTWSYLWILYFMLENTPLSDKEKRVFVLATMLLSLKVTFATAIPGLYGLAYMAWRDLVTGRKSRVHPPQVKVPWDTGQPTV